MERPFAGSQRDTERAAAMATPISTAKLNQVDPQAWLAEIHHRLAERFGPQEPFWLLDPVSRLVMAMVGGKTHSEVSRTAFEALLKRYGSWQAVRVAPVAEIESVIGAVAFPETKASQIKAALAAITRAHGRLTLDPLDGMTVDQATAWLERLPGVGRKVFAATLNFSMLRKATLVIDSHQLRILRRLRLVGRRANLTKAHDIITPILPPEWTAAVLDDHYQLMKVLGRTFCRNPIPICRRGPLDDLCPTAGARRR